MSGHGRDRRDREAVGEMIDRTSRRSRVLVRYRPPTRKNRAPFASKEPSLLDLSGLSALVTGANQGIGWSIAMLLAQQGARVAINYPDDAHFPEQYSALGKETIALKADVGDVDQIHTMFTRLAEAFGGLDILVNNAGIFPRATALELDEATWDRVHDVNLKGTFFCAQEAARLMIPRASGRIVNIASDAALLPAARGSHYNASKAGVLALTKSLALEFAPYHIAVNAVAPGLTDTAQPRDGMTEEEIAMEGAATPWGRIATAEDVARAVLYLVSPLSEYVTGETVLVTGGSLMAP
jgi:NAD(P)-dependent dehydrogenase (short-subunit alcohol dehydrogenase family)